MLHNIMRGVIMFINRNKELQLLNDEYKKKTASFTVIYGRRRIGKTSLIAEYIKDKPAVFFYATEMNLAYQLKEMAQLILDKINKPNLKGIEFNDFDSLIMFLANNLPDDRKFILVIDEYQQLAKLDPSFSGMLQKNWDMHLKDKNIHLILCGSVFSMMLNEVLSYSAPLYGRRTSNIHLKAIPFSHIGDFIPSADKYDLMNIYASFGTVPRYLEIYNDELSFTENLRQNIFDRNSYLYNEARFLLKEEISDISTYFTILEIISCGDTKIGNIGKKIGEHSSYLTRYLQKLIDLDIVEKEVPVLENNPLKSKLGRYRIKDQFVNFWFYYVYKNYSQLEIGNTEYVLKEVGSSFNEKFVSFAYEQYVKESILNDPIKYLGFIPDKIGRWWNNNEEIDLVAFDNNNIAFIECKWQNQPVGYDVYNGLLQKSAGIQCDPKLKKQYVIFSKSEPKKGLKEAECKIWVY
jgi:uncharacterized protein